MPEWLFFTSKAILYEISFYSSLQSFRLCLGIFSLDVPNDTLLPTNIAGYSSSQGHRFFLLTIL